ncbi:MAG: hypothetical protein ACLR56_14070 [Oscillospiraceae bacterium]
MENFNTQKSAEKAVYGKYRYICRPPAARANMKRFAIRQCPK